MRILLGLTGSVASVLYKKLITELQSIGIVDVIITEKANHFVENSELLEAVRSKGGNVYSDSSEWIWFENEMSMTATWHKGCRVLHIDLRDRSSALVIAPCSANTLAKISGGICDNLLTSVARAWDRNRPFIIAPAMNTHMWEHPVTKEHLTRFKTFSNNNYSVSPQFKMLACNTVGMGALPEIEEIVSGVKESLRWEFPLHKAYSHDPVCSGIPTKGHPGAFLTNRKHHTHTGVDLYTEDGQQVHAVEDGKVVGKENFTGASQKTPWWEDTKCILIEGASGVICYGEITPAYGIEVGKQVKRGEYIARVKRVLPLHKARPDIDGHSTSMLHLEIYPHGKYTAFEEMGDNPDSFDILKDPTPFLLSSTNAPERKLKV